METLSKAEGLFLSGLISGFIGAFLYIISCAGIHASYGVELNEEPWAIYVLLIQSGTIWYMTYNLWFAKSWDN